MLQVIAKNSYDSKEDLKDNGFVWDKENKVWSREFASKEEYDKFLEKFMDVTYYGRHAVNKFHSKVIFETTEIKDEAEENNNTLNNNDMKEIKLQQLKENYKSSESEMSFKEYVACESQNDPDFFRWFFDDENLDDYPTLSLEQSNEFDEFLASLGEEVAGACEIHLGLRKGYNGYHLDLIDKDGNTHEDYYKKVLNCEEREEAEKRARELFENDKVIFDY